MAFRLDLETIKYDSWLIFKSTVKSAYLCLSFWISPILVSESQNYQVLSKRQIIEPNLEISPPLSQWYLWEPLTLTNFKFCGNSEVIIGFYVKWPTRKFPENETGHYKYNPWFRLCLCSSASWNCKCPTKLWPKVNFIVVSLGSPLPTGCLTYRSQPGLQSKQ